MKLTIDRREQKATMFGFGKMAGFWLDVKVEISDQEVELIKRNNWLDLPIIHGPRDSVQRVRKIVDGENHFFFDDAGSLQKAEGELIENMKKLKQNMETVQNFAAGGAKEIEL